MVENEAIHSPVDVGFRHEPAEHVRDERIPYLSPQPWWLVNGISYEGARVFVRGQLVETRPHILAHRVQIA